jgi:hypothetical protein
LSIAKTRVRRPPDIGVEGITASRGWLRGVDVFSVHSRSPEADMSEATYPPLSLPSRCSLLAKGVTRAMGFMRRAKEREALPRANRC